MTREQALTIKAALEAAGKTSSPIYELAMAALRQAGPSPLVHVPGSRTLDHP